MNTASLLAAFRHVVHNHPALRLRLLKTKKGWAQHFPVVEPDISGVSIQGKSSVERIAYGRSLLALERSSTFNLQSELPFLAKLIEIDGDFIFSLCLDHIACDESGTDILIHELELAYLREANQITHPSAIGESAFYSYLARESAKRDIEQVNLQYWCRTLADSPLNTWTGKGVEWINGETAKWEIAGARLSSLNKACIEQSYSLFTSLIAAQILIMAETGAVDDFVLNIPVSNRTQASDYRIVANLAMLLHLRIRVDAGEAPKAFIQRVRNQVLEAMAHRQYDYPSLSKLISEEATSRGGSYHWLCGCNYVIERVPLIEDGQLLIERIDNTPTLTGNIVPKASFTLTCRQNSGCLRLSADWDSGLWAISKEGFTTRFLQILGLLTETELESE